MRTWSVQVVEVEKHGEIVAQKREYDAFTSIYD